MRMEESHGHGHWNREKLGPPKPVVSDKEGIAVVKYPANVFSRPKPMTTSLVSFSVNHYDFVQKLVHFDLGPEIAEVTLKRGCEIRLSAVDQTKSPVNDFAVMIAGPYAPEFWVDDGNGGRRTGSASDGNWQAMIVKPQDSGVTLFSGVLPLRVRPEQAVRIRNVRIKPGTRVVGSLSDNVPRPIRNGFAITTTVPKPAANSWNKTNPSLTWSEWTTIAADGTFKLKSVPRSGKIQIIAVCDDWVSSSVPKHHFFVKGQLFDVNADEINPILQMEQTGSVEASITTPDGKPLQSGSITSSPNQQYYKGGANLLGTLINTMMMIENQIRPLDKKQAIDWLRDQPKLPFSECPVKNGKAIVAGFPVNTKHSIVLHHSDYRLDTKAGEAFVGSEPGEATVEIKSADPLEVTYKTKQYKKPTPK